MEPLTALGIAGIWGIYGAIYFLRSSRPKGKSITLDIKGKPRSQYINQA